jgi:ribose/xylose/arabinose/galactoside ABC-type transport system permease subunit
VIEAVHTVRTGSTARAFINADSALLAVLLALVLTVGGILVPHVFQVDNIANVLRSSSIVGLVAVGMTFVMLTGEIDLSVGSIMSLSLVIGGEFLDAGSGVALVVTGLCGLVLGAVNGIAVGYGRINSLIMTLGTLAIYGGLANVVARGQAVYLYQSPAYTWTGKGEIAGLPVPLLIFLAVCAAGAVVLGVTKVGRDINYTGANPVAAWYSGVNVARTKVLVFAISGLLAGLAGPLLASQTNRITPTQGVGFELAAIAIAVLGGTALAGARGTVVGTLIGALIYGFLLNILALSGVETYTEQVLKGCLLIAVVLVFQRLVFRPGGWPLRRSKAVAQ